VALLIQTAPRQIDSAARRLAEEISPAVKEALNNKLLGKKEISEAWATGQQQAIEEAIWAAPVTAAASETADQSAAVLGSVVAT
jgi:hypothetical protein